MGGRLFHRSERLGREGNKIAGVACRLLDGSRDAFAQMVDLTLRRMKYPHLSTSSNLS